MREYGFPLARILPYTGENRLVKTRIFAYFMQCDHWKSSTVLARCEVSFSQPILDHLLL